MGMAMAKTSNSNSACLFLLISGLAVSGATASEVDLTATASSDLTYSDNIDLTSQGERSGVVSIWSLGAAAVVNGNDGDLSFNYDAYQTLHSVDSSRNELFNELALFANKALYRDNINFSADASITNIAQSIEDNANADIISGDTIETRTLNAQLSYQSNPRGWIDFYASVDGGVTSNEDAIGDNNRFGTDITLQNGTKAKNWFWLTDYSYNRSVARDSDEQNYDYTIEQEVGLQPMKRVSPLIRVYYEGYTDDGGSTVESGSWGPAMRYYWHKRSYFEVGYDFSFHDRDFWRGSFVFNPNSRTLVEFDYTRRFFGDAYDFSLSHQSKRMTNSITYTEEVRNFERRFLVDGQDIAEYELVKELSINSILSLRRTSFSFEVRAMDRHSLSEVSEIGDSKLYGAALTATHRLSKNTSLSGSFNYDKNIFESANERDRNDYYRLYDISLTNQFSQSLSWDLSFNHANSSQYKENRASFVLDMVY